MFLKHTHTCQVILYGIGQSAQCEKETQTKCDICHRWCCAIHREKLGKGLRHKQIWCHPCMSRELEEVKEDKNATPPESGL